jgi:hypothetical protein
MCEQLISGVVKFEYEHAHGMLSIPFEIGRKHKRMTAWLDSIAFPRFPHSP